MISKVVCGWVVFSIHELNLICPATSEPRGVKIRTHCEKEKIFFTLLSLSQNFFPTKQIKSLIGLDKKGTTSFHMTLNIQIAAKTFNFFLRFHFKLGPLFWAWNYCKKFHISALTRPVSIWLTPSVFSLDFPASFNFYHSLLREFSKISCPFLFTNESLLEPCFTQ